MSQRAIGRRPEENLRAPRRRGKAKQPADLAVRARGGGRRNELASAPSLSPSSSLPTMSLYVCVTGYTDAPGHTEYIITTDFEDTAGKRHSVSKMHASGFQDLHANPALGLPTTLPVVKTLMTTSAVKDERVAKFQEYLRNAGRARRAAPAPAASRRRPQGGRRLEDDRTVGDPRRAVVRRRRIELPRSRSRAAPLRAPSSAASAAGEAAAAGALPIRTTGCARGSRTATRSSASN